MPEKLRPTLLRFADRIYQGAHFHITTVEWARNRLPGYHTHDYVEIFWLTHGECDHLLNGVHERLETGSLVLMRASDAHQLLPWHGRGGFGFTNVSLSPAAFARLGAAYPKIKDALYPSSGAPFHCVLPRAELDLVNDEVGELSFSEHTLFHLDRLVLGIWHRALRRRSYTPAAVDLPHWLQNAIIRVQEPEIFSQGVAGLVAAAGRCHEHVARACRSHLGKTPSQLVNAARMRHAAHALRMTSRSVTDIALDCGFENPAQFHRVFRATHGVTPGRYRRE